MLGKKKQKKQRVLKLGLDRTFEEIKLNREAGQIKDGEGTVMFEPAAVFDERNKRRFRKKRKLVIYVEGTTEALKFKPITDAEGKPELDAQGNPKLGMDDFNPFWTVRQSKEFVARQVADTLEQHKPMTWTQFILFFALLAIILGVVVTGFSNMGAL